MNVPKELLYTKTHEWVRVEDDTCVIGITDFAQDQLSDLTYVELPGSGDEVAANDEVAVIESVKAASDIYAPLAGSIEAVNEELIERPELINTDPYGEGWIFRLRPSNPADLDELIGADAYEELLPDSD